MVLMIQQAIDFPSSQHKRPQVSGKRYWAPLFFRSIKQASNTEISETTAQLDTGSYSLPAFL